MGILLGLLTALSWGGSDFIARFAAHRIGAFRTMLYMQFTGFLLLSISLPWLGGWGHLADGSGWHPWAWGFLAGTVNCGATLALYRSFEIGKLAVVAPISAAYPALTVVLAMFSGEHLRIERAIGILFTLLGVVLVSIGETSQKPEASASLEHPEHGSKGIGWALCSAAGFGVLFWLLGVRVVPAVGAAPAVWVIRITGTVLTAVLILAMRKPINPPRDRVTGWILAMGLADTGAYVMNNVGMQLEQVSVVSVLASLFGAVTVALAAIFLREQISRRQWLGIVAIFFGIFLISR